MRPDIAGIQRSTRCKMLMFLFPSVPMQEALPPEHGREMEVELPTKVRRRHLEPIRRNVAHAGLDAVGDPLDEEVGRSSSMFWTLIICSSTMIMKECDRASGGRSSAGRGSDDAAHRRRDQMVKITNCVYERILPIYSFFLASHAFSTDRRWSAG